MKVNEAIKRLQEISEAGGGELDLVVPYKDSKILGATPTVEILGITKGFDWDSRKVFIHPAEDLKKD